MKVSALSPAALTFIILLAVTASSGCVRFIGELDEKLDMSMDMDADGNGKVDGAAAVSEAGTPSPDAAPKADASGQSSTSCASAVSAAFSYSANMVVCQKAGPAVTQCTAEAAMCDQANGWHLCTATEFLARGGVTMASPVNAWLKSCIRNNGNYHPPDDNLCTCASVVSSSSDTVGFDCGDPNSFYFNMNYYVAVRAVSACHRLGINYNTATQAYWWHLVPTTTLNAAVCCK